MEKRVIQNVQQQISVFKKKLHEKILSEDEDILDFINNFEIELTKEHFMKRKRVKNVVPYHERCQAKRANGERCTRRKREEDGHFCGTHLKNQPHGVISGDEPEDSVEPTTKNIIVHTQDIKGIIYYIDDFENVYDPVDITNGIKNPKIVAKYKLKEDGTYSIPEFDC